MLRRTVIVLGVVVLVGCLIAAWFAHYPQSGMFATMGIAGPRANSGRLCTGYYRNTSLGRVPTRDVTCHREIDRGSELVYQEYISMDAIT
ncbi:MAG: hypothetical protein ACRD3J_04105, partial [Thermoanaerobaculia bacterium]